MTEILPKQSRTPAAVATSPVAPQTRLTRGDAPLLCNSSHQSARPPYVSLSHLAGKKTTMNALEKTPIFATEPLATYAPARRAIYRQTKRDLSTLGGCACLARPDIPPLIFGSPLPRQHEHDETLSAPHARTSKIHPPLPPHKIKHSNSDQQPVQGGCYGVPTSSTVRKLRHELQAAVRSSHVHRRRPIDGGDAEPAPLPTTKRAGYSANQCARRSQHERVVGGVLQELRQGGHEPLLLVFNTAVHEQRAARWFRQIVARSDPRHVAPAVTRFSVFQKPVPLPSPLVRNGMHRFQRNEREGTGRRPGDTEPETRRVKRKVGATSIRIAATQRCEARSRESRRRKQTRINNKCIGEHKAAYTPKNSFAQTHLLRRDQQGRSRDGTLKQKSLAEKNAGSLVVSLV